MLKNDELREKIADKGITCNNLKPNQLALLHKILSITLAKSACFKGKYKMDSISDYKYMTCSGDYFEEREAVSFNRDGFIGFAGWASSKNLKPIHDGVLVWLDEIAI